MSDTFLFFTYTFFSLRLGTVRPSVSCGRILSIQVFLPGWEMYMGNWSVMVYCLRGAQLNPWVWAAAGGSRGMGVGEKSPSVEQGELADEKAVPRIEKAKERVFLVCNCFRVVMPCTQTCVSRIVRRGIAA